MCIQGCKSRKELSHCCVCMKWFHHQCIGDSEEDASTGRVWCCTTCRAVPDGVQSLTCMVSQMQTDVLTDEMVEHRITLSTMPCILKADSVHLNKAGVNKLARNPGLQTSCHDVNRAPKKDPVDNSSGRSWQTQGKRHSPQPRQRQQQATDTVIYHCI